MASRLGLVLVALAGGWLATPALAAVDLAVSLSAPAGVHVYQTGTYTVNVRNLAGQTAAGVALEIQLPTTNTSPTVHVLGILGARSPSCTASGTKLLCSLGSVRKNQPRSVFFEIALPQSSAPLQIVARVTSNSPDPKQGNNVASHTAALLNYAVPLVAPVPVHNRHCTGQNLVSFYECTLYPSSISSHDIVLDPGGSISFVGAPAGITGTWTQASSTRLSLRYYDGGALAASFEGFGVDGGCFEGITTFPGSPYVSPYEVCP
jgi:hypothetical protein